MAPGSVKPKRLICGTIRAGCFYQGAYPTTPVHFLMNRDLARLCVKRAPVRHDEGRP